MVKAVLHILTAYTSQHECAHRSSPLNEKTRTDTGPPTYTHTLQAVNVPETAAAGPAHGCAFEQLVAARRAGTNRKRPSLMPPQPEESESLCEGTDPERSLQSLQGGPGKAGRPDDRHGNAGHGNAGLYSLSLPPLPLSLSESLSPGTARAASSSGPGPDLGTGRSRYSESADGGPRRLGDSESASEPRLSILNRRARRRAGRWPAVHRDS